MALYLPQGMEEGGKDVASQPGYQADAMTSEASVSVVLVSWWIPPTGDEVPLGGLRPQDCAADTRRGGSRRNASGSMEREERGALCVSRQDQHLCNQERFFSLLESR